MTTTPSPLLREALEAVKQYFDTEISETGDLKHKHHMIVLVGKVDAALAALSDPDQAAY